MRRPTIHLMLPLLLSALAALGGCVDTTTGGYDEHPYPPLNAEPFDRDLPAEAALTTMLQTGDTIYFFGGRADDGDAVDSVWAYVLPTRTWLDRAPMPTPRFYAGAVAVGGAIYVIGGRDNTANADESERLQRVVERYDPVRNEWTELPAASPAGFDATYPTTVAAARGRIYAVSTLRTSRSTRLYESTDGITWSEHRLFIEPGLEPTLMSDGDDLFLLTGDMDYIGATFHRIDPTTRDVDRDAPAYGWMRGYGNRWVELDGSIYNVNGVGGSNDVLAIYGPGRSWAFNSVPYEITTNRHFAPIVTDRGLGALYFCAPPQLRIGFHYAPREHRFYSE